MVEEAADALACPSGACGECRECVKRTAEFNRAACDHYLQQAADAKVLLREERELRRKAEALLDCHGQGGLMCECRVCVTARAERIANDDEHEIERLQALVDCLANERRDAGDEMIKLDTPALRAQLLEWLEPPNNLDAWQAELLRAAADALGPSVGVNADLRAQLLKLAANIEAWRQDDAAGVAEIIAVLDGTGYFNGVAEQLLEAAAAALAGQEDIGVKLQALLSEMDHDPAPEYSAGPSWARKLRAALAGPPPVQDESLFVQHARKQGAADGFQQGWHAAIERVIAGDVVTDLRELCPKPPALAASSSPWQPNSLLESNRLWRRVWCDSCQDVVPLLTDYLPANGREDKHAALDLLCGNCRLIIATLHEIDTLPSPPEATTL